jgi:NADP-dependent 3-hydroxy acid dehydrogenase YdfG
MNKTILITGATSGFGEAIAKKFAAAKWHCIITGRREEKLQRLSKILQDSYGIKVLPQSFDVHQKEQVFSQINALAAEWREIDVLVNNAGLALGRDNFETASLTDWDTMIDTNVKGLLYVSKAVLPYMIEKGKGHIINIGSTAAKAVYENGNVYCASKHAVNAISEAQRIDLLKHKIKVTAIHPGAAETEFSLVRFKGNQNKAAEVYKGFTPLNAEDVAGVVYYAATLPAHVCINDLVLTSTAQADNFYFFKE